LPAVVWADCCCLYLEDWTVLQRQRTSNWNKVETLRCIHYLHISVLYWNMANCSGKQEKVRNRSPSIGKKKLVILWKD